MKRAGVICLVLGVVLLTGGCKKKPTGYRESLHHAAETGDIGQAQTLIRRGADVNARGHWDRTPLHVAAHHGQADVVRLLIAHGADINATDRRGATPLSEAAGQGHRDLAMFLIAAGAEADMHLLACAGDLDGVGRYIATGADVNAVDAHGRTPLHLAASKGHVDVARLLVQHSAVVDAYSGEHRTPLHEAASGGHYRVADFLIEQGADVDAKADRGATALHLASREGHKNMVELLLVRGADPDAIAGYGWLGGAPLHAAARGGHRDVVETLVTAGADINAKNDGGQPPLVAALACDRRDVVEFLLARGASYNVEDQGYRLLCFAARHGLLDLAQRLLSEGVETAVQIPPWSGGPLWAAVSNQHRDVAELLIAHGADVSETNRSGKTLLDEALRRRNRELVELLLVHGGDVDGKDDNGNTPLHRMARDGDGEIATVLIANGADVNAKNWGATTPLHYAASHGHRDLVALLAANGASVNVQDGDGDTPLHGAALRGRADVVKLLLACGADVTMRDNAGRTPLDEAVRRGREGIVRLFAGKGPTAGAGPAAETATRTVERSHASRPTHAAVSDPNLEHLRVDRVPLAAVAVARRNVRAAVRGNCAFAIDLYRQLRSKEGNLFFSPYSVSMALAMTYAAARENTAKEMAETLRFTLRQEDLHPAMAELQTGLKRVQEAGDVKLHIANSLWPQIGKLFSAAYLLLVKQYYGISITPVDYKTPDTREKARHTINAWVEDNTEDKIKELILPRHLDEFTRLILVNAIYFKGKWKGQFDPNDTENAAFHLNSQTSVQVPMMTQKEEFEYAEVEDLQVLKLPYRGEGVSMLILLPKAIDGLRDLEGGLSVERLEFWRQRVVKKEVIVFLPKFNASFGIELKEVLQAMGMVDAFKWPGANFAGLDGDPRWFYIGEVIHKAFVEVNEEGTEAAAATVVVMGMGGMPPQLAVFRADHPFLFLIQEDKTGSILFMGRVTDPTKAGS